MSDSSGIEYVILFLIFLAIRMYLEGPEKVYKLPPSPNGLLLGYTMLFWKSAPKKMKQLSETYGKILRVRSGRKDLVFLNDFNSVKEAFNNPAILDRPGNLFFMMPNEFGLLSHNGAEWTEQRRYCIRSLKDIGVGSRHWETLLEEEVDDFIKFLDSKRGRPTDITSNLSMTLSTNLMSVITGKRLQEGDSRRRLIDDAIQAMNRIFTATSITAIFPYLVKSLNKLGFRLYEKDLVLLEKFNTMIWKEVKKRESVPKLERNKDIFIDRYLSEIEEKKRSFLASFFRDDNLVANAQALVAAGTDTSTQSLMWLLVGVTAHEEIQNRVQAEIDRVLGRDGKPKWSERDKFPYTNAVILEAQRWRTVVPFGVLHKASSDTTIGGYDIPKGTTIISNVYALHNDPEYWRNPDIFDPLRFLNDDGSLKTQKMQSYVPFSTGKRSCPGEIIASIEIFHYFISILQKFRLRVPEGKTVILEERFQALCLTVPQKIRYLPRD